MSQLENVYWSSVPVQIGDPIVAPPGEYVWKNIDIQVSPLLIRKTFGLDSWKTVHPSLSAKVA